jgi:hypothetical protein
VDVSLHLDLLFQLGFRDTMHTSHHLEHLFEYLTFSLQFLFFKLLHINHFLDVRLNLSNLLTLGFLYGL